MRKIFTSLLTGAALAVTAAAPAALTTAAVAQDAEAPATKEVLEEAIADIRSGDPDLSRFTDELGAQIDAQQDAVDTFFAQSGAVENVAYQMEQEGIDVYLVQFENADTVWGIAMEGDKIATLAFRPVQAQQAEQP
jgi:ABC-type transporter Mla subunit MlaD